MKKYLLSFLFLVGVIVFSHAQYPSCMLDIWNATGTDLIVGIQTVDNSPNDCGITEYVGSFDIFVPDGGPTSVFLGTAVVPDPPIRPFRVGCYDSTDLSTASWQINTCWNPDCVDSEGSSFDIQFTLCGDYITEVTIF